MAAKKGSEAHLVERWKARKQQGWTASRFIKEYNSTYGTKYTADQLEKATNSRASKTTTSKTSTSKTTSTSNKQDELIDRLLRDPTFGPIIRPFVKVAELRPLIANLAPVSWGGKGWTESKFLLAVQQTKWWTSKSDAQLQWKTLTEGQKESEIRKQAAELAAWLQANGGQDWFVKKGYADLARKVNQPGGILRYWAWQIASGQRSLAEWELTMTQGLMGDTTSELAIMQLQRREELARLAKRPEEMAEELWQQARGEYFLPLSKDSAKKWAQAIIDGKSSFGEFKDYMRKEASEMYPKWAESINNGVLPKALFGPALTILSGELEMSEEAIIADASLWGQLTANAAGQGGGFTASDWVRYARNSPRWKNTRGANIMAADFSERLLRTFGAIA